MMKKTTKKTPATKRAPPARRDPREALTLFHQGHSTGNALLRTLAEHDGWIAPVTILMTAYGATSLSNVIMFGEETSLPPGNIWLFTDMAAATRAQEAGAHLGACEGSILGADLFAGFDPRWGVLMVNPGSPPDETLKLEGDGIGELNAWGRAVALEAAMTAGAEAGYAPLLDRIRAYENFFLVSHEPTHEPVTVVTSREGTLLVAFTAPDCLEAYFQKMNASRTEFRPILATGAELCSVTLEQKLDGIRLNPFGPGPDGFISGSVAADVLGIA